jgi:hypothetical protein
MQTSRGASKLIWYEAMGFGTIIAISWLDELIGLPQLLFGGASVPNWKESVLESGITLLVAIPTLLLSSRLTRRLYRLEGFLRLCAWCRKVELDGRWVPVEEFLLARLDTVTSHGMCPDCEATAMPAAAHAA